MYYCSQILYPCKKRSPFRPLFDLYIPLPIRLIPWISNDVWSVVNPSLRLDTYVYLPIDTLYYLIFSV